MNNVKRTSFLVVFMVIFGSFFSYVQPASSFANFTNTTFSNSINNALIKNDLNIFEEICKIAKNFKFNLNFQNENGYTLAMSITRGYSELDSIVCLNLLYDNSLNFYLYDNNNCSVLMTAICLNNQQVIKFCVDKGIRLFDKDLSRLLVMAIDPEFGKKKERGLDFYNGLISVNGQPVKLLSYDDMMGNQQGTPPSSPTIVPIDLRFFPN